MAKRFIDGSASAIKRVREIRARHGLVGSDVYAWISTGPGVGVYGIAEVFASVIEDLLGHSRKKCLAALGGLAADGYIHWCPQHCVAWDPAYTEFQQTFLFTGGRAKGVAAYLGGLPDCEPVRAFRKAYADHLPPAEEGKRGGGKQSEWNGQPHVYPPLTPPLTPTPSDVGTYAPPLEADPDRWEDISSFACDTREQYRRDQR
jgi:hypothetical protein